LPLADACAVSFGRFRDAATGEFAEDPRFQVLAG
jgi:hypothetical protein